MGTKELKTGDDTGTLVELEAERDAAQRLAVQLAHVVFWYEECCFAPDVHKDYDCPDLPDYYDDTIELWRRAHGIPQTPWSEGEEE